MESRNNNYRSSKMNMAQIAKSKGGKEVSLKLERHAIYASKSGSNFNISNVNAIELNGSYYWNNVAARRHGDWLESEKARWLIIEAA
jgi:hypothetical protein